MEKKAEDKNKGKEESKPVKKQSNMHEGIADWCDCCSCEPEERWVEIAERMDIDLSDYEE
jgi:hypothetical protein